MNCEIQGKLLRFVDLWREKRGGLDLPGRRDFSFADLRPWIGNLAIVRVDEPDRRLFVRLFGEQLCKYYGFDLSGCYLDQVLGAQQFAYVYEAYELCISMRLPVFARSPTYLTKYGNVSTERVLVPCGTGGTVEHVVACLYEAQDLRRARCIEACTFYRTDYGILAAVGAEEQGDTVVLPLAEGIAAPPRHTELSS